MEQFSKRAFIKGLFASSGVGGLGVATNGCAQTRTITLQGTAPATNFADGAVVFSPFLYESNLPDPDVYNNFEIFDRRIRVRNMSFLKVSQTGSYSNNLMAEILVMDFAGTLLKTASLPVNLSTAPTLSWVHIPLSGALADRVVDVGEQLIAHVWRDGPSGGDYRANVHFTASVRIGGN